MEWLPAHIRRRAGTRVQVSVVHGDYRLDNLIFPRPSRGAGGARLGTVHARPPARRLQLPLHVVAHPAGRSSAASAARPSPPWASPEAATSRRYCDAPVSPRQSVMADWNFYLAYNLFRIAAILQGIAKRVVDGTASSAQAVGGRRRPAAGRDGLAHFASRA